jgi:hypothetical protein
LVGIDNGVQTISILAELNYGFIDRNVIRINTIYRLWIGFLYLQMDGGSMTIDAQFSKINIVYQNDRSASRVGCDFIAGSGVGLRSRRSNSI